MGSIQQLSIVKGPTRHLQINTLHNIFENLATGEYKNNTALIFEVNGEIRQHTYSEVNCIANKLARTIQKSIKVNNCSRNKDGDYIVAVNMHPSDHLVIVLLAIWKAGAAYLPLDPAFPGPRIEHIVREANPALIIYDEDSEFYLTTHKLSFDELVNQCNSQLEDNLLENERFHHLKLDLAIVLYTSGSTGVPKGVRLPHKVILNRLQWQFKRFPYSSTENVCVFKTALTFVDCVSEIWGPLLSGRSILVIPKATTKDPERMVNLLEKYKIERLILVPTLLRSLLMLLELKKNRSALRNLKTWICSGEILPVSLAEEFYRWFSENDHQLCNFYGSTEIMGDVTYFVIPGLDQLKHLDKVPIGNPVDNTIIYLLDKDFRPVKSGDIGELFVSGSNLAAGYVNGRDPEKFLENPLAINTTFSRLYRTGDFARLEKGVLFYEGRTDSQVKIRGHRVDMTEVEKAVSSIDGVEKAIVLCYRPGDINQALLAFVQTNNLMCEHDIENAIKEKLTSYMVPQVILIEKVPLLVNGKIDRQTLLKSYENTNNNDDSVPEVEINYEGVAPHQMEAAEVLFQTIAGVLNRAARFAISVDANFFDIGGNSLNSIYTISKLSEQGYQMKISDFLSAVDLGEVLLRMTSDSKIDTQAPKFSGELLHPQHKKVVSDIIAASFYQKADLEQWIKSDVSLSDYYELVDKLWEPLLEKNLSFVVKSRTGEVIGAALNFDVRDEPEIELQSKLTVIFEFLENLEGPVSYHSHLVPAEVSQSELHKHVLKVHETLLRTDSRLSPEKGENLHSFMMATHASLTPKENVAVMQFIEGEVLKLAKGRNFKGVFTTNTNPLTQQLGFVYNYQVFSDYQVNQYIASDNTKPFGLAPDDQRAIVAWKPIV